MLCLRACSSRACDYSAPHRLTFSPQAVFHGPPSLESDPHCPHYTVSHPTSSYLRWRSFLSCLRACRSRGCVYSAPHKLTFSPQAVFSRVSETRKRPPLPALRGVASHKFVLALEKLFVMFARMPKPGVSTRPLTNLLFPPKAALVRCFHVTESRPRPPLPALHGFASDKFIHVLEKLFVTFARMP